MALGTPAVISTINDNTDATSYAGTSTAASASALLIAFVGATRGSSTDPPVPTVANTPWGLTWTRLTTADKMWVATGTPRKGGWIFVAKTSGAAGSDSFDLSFSATVASCTCCVVEITGADLSGAADAAIVQIATPNSGGASTFATTLSAASDADNRAIAHYQCTSAAGSPSIIHDSGGGWTEIDERNTTAPGTQHAVHWLGTGFDTSPSATASTGAPSYGAWSLEVKEGAGGGGPTPPDWFSGVVPI